MQVVTYMSSNGNRINVCARCKSAAEDAGTWPRDDRGAEYCQVHMGAHEGNCSFCVVGHDIEGQG